MEKWNGTYLVLHRRAIFRTLEWWLNGRDPVSSLVSFLKKSKNNFRNSVYKWRLITWNVSSGTSKVLCRFSILEFGWQMCVYIAKIACERKTEEIKVFTVKSEQKIKSKISRSREFDNWLPSVLSFLAKYSFVPFSSKETEKNRICNFSKHEKTFFKKKISQLPKGHCCRKGRPKTRRCQLADCFDIQPPLRLQKGWVSERTVSPEISNAQLRSIEQPIRFSKDWSNVMDNVIRKKLLVAILTTEV